MHKPHFFVEHQEAVLLQVAAVVTQPGKQRGGKPPKALPVEVLAAEWLRPEQILCPESASDVRAVDSVTQILYSLCICGCEMPGIHVSSFCVA